MNVFEDPRGEPERIRTSRIQRAVAARMLAASSEVPSFSLREEIDVASVIALRGGWDPDDPDRPTVNDFVVRAAALALREHPRVNAAWNEGTIERFARVNIGIAVAVGEVLAVPTLLDADRHELRALARETRRLVTAVRDRTITPSEMSGATFTVSNLGMCGILDFDAIISVPQAAILAVSAAREAPVVHGGAVVPGIRMGVRLTCDHRLVYGADGAAFLRTLRALLERPGDWALG